MDSINAIVVLALLCWIVWYSRKGKNKNKKDGDDQNTFHGAGVLN